MADRDRPEGRGGAPERRHEPEGTIRVLLIEDDHVDAFLLRELLSQSDLEFSLTWARSLADGIAAMGDDIDCVLVDLDLPDAHRFDALESILDHDPTAAVVVLTGLDEREAGSRAVGLGAQDYLVKGKADPEALTRSLHYAIARQHSDLIARQLREAQLLSAENARLERGLMARPLISNPRLSWTTRYQPGGQRALLGGDFFDAIEREDGSIRLVLGDVCGHGPDEAALGVALRVAWRSLVLADQPTADTIPTIQRVLEAERTSNETFATLCDIELDAGLSHAQVRLAGHPSPLLVAPPEVTEIQAGGRGPLLGVFPEARWPVTGVDLVGDWTLVVFTDGIIEGRAGPGGDRFETTGLSRLAAERVTTDTSLDDLANALISGAELANGEPLCDDLALMILSPSERWR